MTADATTAPTIEEPAPPTVVEPQAKRKRRKLLLLLALLGALVVLVGLSVWYLLFRQPITEVLPGLPNTAMPAYSTSIYGVTRPTGIAVTADGSRIYTTTYGQERAVAILDGAGNVMGTAKAPDGVPGFVPVFVALDPLTGDLYVSERSTGRIFVYGGDGTFKRRLVVPERPGFQAVGLAFDPSGNFYFVNTGAAESEVVEVDRSAKIVTTFGKGDKMYFPNGLAVDADGYVYVADSNNGRLLVYARDGHLVTKVGRGVGAGLLGLPRSVAIDSKSRVYVADTTGQQVSVYGAVSSPTADRLEYIGGFGTEGASDASFEYPTGVAVDGRGRIYVSDTMNDRLQVWSY